MKSCVVATYFKTLGEAQKGLKEREKLQKVPFRILEQKDGFYVIAESAVKKSGLDHQNL